MLMIILPCNSDERLLLENYCWKSHQYEHCVKVRRC